MLPHDKGALPVKRPLALYIHWPYCRKICPYCDYNTYQAATLTPDDRQRWRQALCKVIEHYRQRFPDRVITSIFFGGGTPSLMPLELVNDVIEAAAGSWPLYANCEITLEANPTSASRSLFESLRQAGVNRLSVGVQSLNDRDLSFLGRQHNAAEARATLESAAAVFDRWSLDMMYGRPQQTLAAWQQELEEALSYNPRHMALYQLTIEPGTPFYRQVSAGTWQLPDEETQASLYEHTHERCAQAGLVPYEISSAAAVGQECRHNLAYWRYQEYLGIGCGAHSRMIESGTRIALSDIRHPLRWLESVEKHGHGVADEQVLSVSEQVQEVILLGMRSREGIAKAMLTNITGKSRWEDMVAPECLSSLIEQQLVLLEGDRLSATRLGWSVLNYVEQQLCSGSLL